jgi:hypothetical protein
MLNHEAIRRAYPNAVTIDDGTGAFDADGNQIQLDQALVDAAAIEVAAEQALAVLRRQRNQLLTETDYLALADATLTDEMRTYRQALRDLPANTVDPANPVWPVKPGGN